MEDIDLEINPEVKKIISVFDTVFADLGQVPLMENDQFEIDRGSWGDCIIFHSKDRVGQVKLAFEISSQGVVFYIDRTSEMPIRSIEIIRKHPNEFEREIRDIFSSRMLVEYKGNKTTIKLFNAYDRQIETYTFFFGLIPNWFSETKETIYEPFFECSDNLEVVRKHYTLTVKTTSKKLRIIHFTIDCLTILLFQMILEMFGLPFSKFFSLILFSLELFIYYTLMEYYFQQTVGKMLTETIVINENSQKPDLKTCLLRTVIRFIPLDPFSFLPTPHRGWHDRLTNTYVIQKDYVQEFEAIIKKNHESIS